MRTLIPVLLVFVLLAFSYPASAAIDRLQKGDFPRFAIGIANLYYNIGKGCFQYAKDCLVGLPNLPKGVAVDVLNVGKKGEPAYYLTKKERKERDRQKRLESRLRADEDRAESLDEGDSPLGTIKP